MKPLGRTSLKTPQRAWVQPLIVSREDCGCAEPLPEFGGDGRVELADLGVGHGGAPLTQQTRPPAVVFLVRRACFLVKLAKLKLIAIH
jgi:hypothetical protein